MAPSAQLPRRWRRLAGGGRVGRRRWACAERATQWARVELSAGDSVGGSAANWAKYKFMAPSGPIVVAAYGACAPLDATRARRGASESTIGGLADHRYGCGPESRSKRRESERKWAQRPAWPRRMTRAASGEASDKFRPRTGSSKFGAAQADSVERPPARPQAARHGARS